MAFARDVDLLAFEPTLFTDVVWSSQRLAKGQAALSTGGLSITTPDLKIGGLGITPGHVVVFAGVALEIVSSDQTSMVVTVPRRAGTEATHPPSGLSSGVFEIVTFRNQLEVAHRQTLRLAGIDPDDADASPGAGEILNPGALRPLECFVALSMIFTAASSLTHGPGSMSGRALAYAELARAERKRVGVAIDLDGDGVADATRRLVGVGLVRG